MGEPGYGGGAPEFIGSKTVRVCRTVHGPVEERQGTTAYARRYAIWGHEIDTLTGLAALDDAGSVTAAKAAAAKLTWNENLLVADDAGHIGWWHPGNLPLRAKRWDERLPLPGTGSAEWRGLLPFAKHPQAIDPAQGYLMNWNNLPSAGWTNGDAVAPETNVGDLNRATFLNGLVRTAAASPSLDALRGVERVAGVTAQQRPLLDTRLRAADGAATGSAKAVLDTIVAWDGNYDRTDSRGTVDPGVAAFEALKEAASNTLPAAARTWLGKRGSSHLFDIGAAEAAGIHGVSQAGLIAAAGNAASALQAQFGSADPSAWREPRKMYDVQVQGVADKPQLKFYDRGTWAQAVELGP